MERGGGLMNGGEVLILYMYLTLIVVSCVVVVMGVRGEGDWAWRPRCVICTLYITACTPLSRP